MWQKIYQSYKGNFVNFKGKVEGRKTISQTSFWLLKLNKIVEKVQCSECIAKQSKNE